MTGLREIERLPDGRRAQLWLGGADDGPLVVLHHGCPDTRHAAMAGHRAARDAGVRLLCVNRPGYGRSDPHESSHASVADDLLGVVDRLGAGRFAVLGMSVGGAYALACAARHPERVGALGLVAAQPEPTVPDDRPVPVRAEAARAGFEDWAASIDVEDPDDAALVARWLRGRPPGDVALLTAQPVAAVAAAAREALAQPQGYLRDAALLAGRWSHRPEEVRCPAVLWYGELDDRATPATGAGLAARFPRARLVVRPATTHWATLAAHWDDVLTTLRESLGTGRS